MHRSKSLARLRQRPGRPAGISGSLLEKFPGKSFTGPLQVVALVLALVHELVHLGADREDLLLRRLLKLAGDEELVEDEVGFVEVENYVQLADVAEVLGGGNGMRAACGARACYAVSRDRARPRARVMRDLYWRLTRLVCGVSAVLVYCVVLRPQRWKA